MAVSFSLHPDYEDNRDDWETYRDLFDGKHRILVTDKYLWRHSLETGVIAASAKLRAIREQRTRYLNLIEPIISRYTSLFFHKDPDLSEVDDLFGEDIYDVTGTGKSLITFLKEDVLRANLLYGRPIALTDSYGIRAPNLEAQEAMKLRPLLEVLNPLEVKDWEIETEDPRYAGQVKWLRCEYQRLEPRVNATEAPKIEVYSKVFSFEHGENGGVYTVSIYRKIRDSKSATNTNQWEQVSETMLAGVPEMPVRILIGESWVKDTSEQQLKLFNLESSRDSIQYQQAYQRTYIIGNVSTENALAISEYTNPIVPEGTQIHTIEPSQTTALDINIERTMNNLFRVAFNQNRTTSADSKSVESADTQQETKEQLTALILSEIETLENFTNKIIKDYAFFKTGKTDFEGKVYFNRDLKADDVAKQIELFNALRDEINRVPIWREATLRRLVDFQQLPEAKEIKEKITGVTTTFTDQSLAQTTEESGVNVRDQLLQSLNGNQRAA